MHVFPTPFHTNRYKCYTIHKNCLWQSPIASSEHGQGFITPSIVEQNSQKLNIATPTAFPPWLLFFKELAFHITVMINPSGSV